MHKDQASAIACAPLWGKDARNSGIISSEMADCLESIGAYGSLYCLGRLLREAAAATQAAPRALLLIGYAQIIEKAAEEVRSHKGAAQ